MILLIQFRTDQSGPHEITCVFNAFGGDFQDLETINAYANHVSTDDLIGHVQEAEAVLLGGCGEQGFESTNPADKAALKNLHKKMWPVVDMLITEDIPTLGLCFGHQLIASIRGGEIRAEKDMAETGIAEISLTDAAENDPIFSILPSPFHAVVGHKASVTKKPQATVNLAASDRCQLQALRYGENVYTCQFHPELGANELMERLKLYPGYMENEIAYDRDTELEAKQITNKFYERYL